MFVNITISDSGVMASLRTYDVLASLPSGERCRRCHSYAVRDTSARCDRFSAQIPMDILDLIKAAAAIGLLSARWSPGLARLTTAMLTIYFALAVGFHAKARDLSVAALGAAANTALFAALTLKEPAVADVRVDRT